MLRESSARISLNSNKHSHSCYCTCAETLHLLGTSVEIDAWLSLESWMSTFLLNDVLEMTFSPTLDLGENCFLLHNRSHWHIIFLIFFIVSKHLLCTTTHLTNTLCSATPCANDYLTSFARVSSRLHYQPRWCSVLEYQALLLLL